jgi:hypothetical protein
VFVQDLQHGRGALSSGLGPATQFGHAGSALAEQDVQESAGDGQTDADGLGGGGELGLAVPVEDHGVLEASLPVVAAGLGLFELLAEMKGFLAVRRDVEVVAEGVGLSVDGLSAQAVFLGDACDGTIASKECGGGAGDALGKG